MRNLQRGANPVLLVVAVLGVGFGILGWLGPTGSGDDVQSTSNQTPPSAAEDDDADPLASRSGNRPIVAENDDHRAPVAGNGASAAGSAGFAIDFVDPALHGDGIITGIVYDAYGRGLSGVVLSLYPSWSGPGQRPDPVAARNLSERDRARYLVDALRRETVSNSDGEFKATDLLDGAMYRITSQSPEFGEIRSVEAYPGDHAELYVISRGFIAGVVRTRAGQPVTSFRIQVKRGNGTSTREFDDPDGKFRFSTRDRGPVTIEALCNGYYMIEPASVTLGSGETRVELIVDPAAMLSGVVRDSNGDPVNGAMIIPELVDGTAPGDGAPAELGSRSDLRRRERRGHGIAGWPLNRDARTTDVRGRYEFPNLAPGSYAIRAEFGADTQREPVTLQVGDAKTLDFTVSRGPCVRVIVVDQDGAAIMDDVSCRFERTNGSGGGYSSDTRVGPNIWLFDRQEPNTISIEISCAGYAPYKQAIDFSVQQHWDVVAVLVASAQLMGTVRLPDGTPVRRPHSLRARADAPASAGDPGEQPRPYTTELDDIGRFTFEQLPPGAYQLQLVANGAPDVVLCDFGLVNVSSTTPQQDLVATAPRLRVTVRARDPEAMLPASIRAERTSRDEPADQGGHRPFDELWLFSEGTLDLLFASEGEYVVRVGSESAVGTATVWVGASGAAVTVEMRAVDSVRVTSASRVERYQPGLDLQVGDVIVNYNGTAVTSPLVLADTERSTGGQSTVLLMIERDGVAMTLEGKGGPLGVEVEAWSRGR